MPPKKKNIKPNDTVNDEEAEITPVANVNLATLQSSLEALIDNRMKQQINQMNDLLTKHSNSTKVVLTEIKSSQEFLGSKFDELANTIIEVRAENKKLQKDNDDLQRRVCDLENRCRESDTAIENLRQYSRRDTLEIHGIPVVEGENTNDIVVKVAKMAAPECNFNEPMLSISHRLPSRRRGVPAIIAKFVQRDIRDLIYNNRRNLSSQTIQDLGFDTASRIYVNESLTAQSQAIFAEVKKFRNHHGFKYIWTRNGKVHLKISDSQQAKSHVFNSMQEFDDFKSRFNDTSGHND
jgi:cell division protein FtsB